MHHHLLPPPKTNHNMCTNGTATPTSPSAHHPAPHSTHRIPPPLSPPFQGTDADTTTHHKPQKVHERDRNTDFLLIVLRDLIATRRPDLKLILMSATLQARVWIRECVCVYQTTPNNNNREIETRSNQTHNNHESKRETDGQALSIFRRLPRRHHRLHLLPRPGKLLRPHWTGSTKSLIIRLYFAKSRGCRMGWGYVTCVYTSSAPSATPSRQVIFMRVRHADACAVHTERRYMKPTSIAAHIL